MEKMLASNISEALSRHGVEARISVIPGRIVLRDVSELEEALRAVSRVFGVKSASPAVHYKSSGLDDIVRTARDFFRDRVRGRVFMVRVRRVGKHSFTSKDVERLVGASLLEYSRGVDLENPEYTAFIEIRDSDVYMYDKLIPGPGGLPLGSEDPVMVLFSGGFDSTVASWRLMRRGCPVTLLYFDLGSEYALSVALEAAKRLASEWSFGHKLRMVVVNFKGPLMLISGLVAPPYRILVMRRVMLEQAVRVAKSLGIEALATGESVGQVASQTIRNLYLISSGLELPVLRPLAGSDKDEIVEEARRIGLYDIVSRQVELCGQAPNPTPRASIREFWREYEKVRELSGIQLPTRVIEL
jgi:thiamine biosynthesis protein ThiI